MYLDQWRYFFSPNKSLDQWSDEKLWQVKKNRNNWLISGQLSITPTCFTWIRINIV